MRRCVTLALNSFEDATPAPSDQKPHAPSLGRCGANEGFQGIRGDLGNSRAQLLISSHHFESWLNTIRKAGFLRFITTSTRKGASKYDKINKPLVAGSYHPLVTIRRCTCGNPGTIQGDIVVPKFLAPKGPRGTYSQASHLASAGRFWDPCVTALVKKLSMDPAENLGLQLLAPKVVPNMEDAFQSQPATDPLPHLDIAR